MSFLRSSLTYSDFSLFGWHFLFCEPKSSHFKFTEDRSAGSQHLNSTY